MEAFYPSFDVLGKLFIDLEGARIKRPARPEHKPEKAAKVLTVDENRSSWCNFALLEKKVVFASDKT